MQFKIIKNKKTFEMQTYAGGRHPQNGDNIFVDEKKLGKVFSVEMHYEKDYHNPNLNLFIECIVKIS